MFLKREHIKHMEREESEMIIQIEIDEEKLMQLFEQGVLCASDFRCLNSESKQQVSKLCLTSCSKRLKTITCNIPIAMYKQAH